MRYWASSLLQMRRFYLSFLCHFLGSLYIFVGKAWVEGKKGELARGQRTENGLYIIAP